MKSIGMLKMWQGLLHLVYPKLCIGCGRDQVSEEQLICLDCLEALPLTDFHLHAENPVEKMFRGRLNVNTASSYVYFTKQSAMQNVLHHLKYKGVKEAGHYFGKRMGKALKQSFLYENVDALIPLPLFHSKEKKRGYNQSAVICEGIAEIMQIPVWNDVVERRQATETQTKKSRTERWKNIEGKFEVVAKDKIDGKHVLLVDDVLTTGATLEACGSEILKVKNVKLGIVTLAYTSS